MMTPSIRQGTATVLRRQRIADGEYRRQAAIASAARIVVAAVGCLAFLVLLGFIDEHDRQIIAADAGITQRCQP